MNRSRCLSPDHSLNRFVRGSAGAQRSAAPQFNQGQPAGQAGARGSLGSTTSPLTQGLPGAFNLSGSATPNGSRGDKRTRALACGLTVAVSLTLAACGGGRHAGNEPSPAATPALAPRAVRLAPVLRSGAAGEALVPASVQARRHAVLSARISATVVALPSRVGERVAQGALLVRLDAAALESAVAAAEASLGAAEADRARLENLLKKNAATARERDEAEARAAGARAALSGARDSLAYAVLRAPFAGTVAARQVELGDVVQPGRPLIEIEGDGGLELLATVDGAQAAGLRRGQELRAHVDGQAEPLRVVVTTLALAGDPATHRFELRADLPATPGLRSGLFARLVLPAAGAEPGLSIPAAAAFARGGLTGVFVAQDGRARLRFVAPGARSGDTLEVRAGLAEGERVVLDPLGLVDGTPLTATETR